MAWWVVMAHGVVGEFICRPGGRLRNDEPIARVGEVQLADSNRSWRIATGAGGQQLAQADSKVEK